MIPVQIRFTKKLLESIDRLVGAGIYSNRSEALRDAARRHVERLEENNQETQIGIGVCQNCQEEVTSWAPTNQNIKKKLR